MSLSVGLQSRNSPGVRQHRPAFKRRRGSRLHLPDFWKAPLHDFPIRDEILFQFLPGDLSGKVLEIGPGSGFTAYRLAPDVKQLTLVDAAERSLATLRDELGCFANLSFACADLGRPGLVEIVGGEFDVAFGLDVFEYIPNPEVCFQNLRSVLRPGGMAFLSFPNVPPPTGDGVTWFDKLETLDETIASAGFSYWEVFAVRPRSYASAVYSLLHEWPLRTYRRLRSQRLAGRPQVYENTWAFQQRRRLLRYKNLLHIWWAFLSLCLRFGSEVFQVEPLNDNLLGRQLVIRAWR